MQPTSFEVIIIGGSYAGLSAAMSLGRSKRTVLVIDAGKPCNRQTPHSHNFLTQDGKTPAEIALLGKDQVSQYPTVSFLNGEVEAVTQTTGGFNINIRNGGNLSSKKIVLATGITDLLPPIPGLQECWGITAVHCPYCHGYELRDKNTGILANGDAAMHYAMLISNLTNQLTIFTNGPSEFTETQLEKLNNRNISVDPRPLQNILHEHGNLTGIRFSDSTERSLDVIYTRPAFVQPGNIAASLGCETDEHGYLRISARGLTTVPGVYACGDNSNPMRSVATAVASGNLAGASVNAALCEEQF